MQLNQGLAKSTRIAQIAARYDDPVGDLPAEPLQYSIDDGLLAFETERIDGIHQIDAETVGDLPDALHGIVEVAEDLDRRALHDRVPARVCRRRFFPSR